MSELNFNVELTMATEQFNQAVNTVVHKTESMQTRLSQAIQAINTNSQTAQSAIANLMTVNDTDFVVSMNNASQTLNGLQAGAKLSEVAVNDALSRMQTHIMGLNNDLTMAQEHLRKLQISGKSLNEIVLARQKIHELKKAISEATATSNQFAHQTSNAMLKAEQSAQNAQDTIYGMLNIRTNSSIQAEIKAINDGLKHLKQNSTLSKNELARVTSHAKAKIASLNAEMGKTNKAMSVLNGSIGAVRGSVGALSSAMSGLTGLFAMLGVGVGAKELLGLAEGFKSVGAQVRLAVGDGTAFINAMQTVTDIANETRMPLDEVANLYTRINRVGKELGMTGSDVAEVTMTINKAMQVSGGSAESMNAALTQLIQGLGSGVLRGDEFNSVMEQSPRLARALADGLGVGTSELRAMAGEGKLTADTVIDAIKSQTDVIDAEFAKMPVTVDGSLTVLKNKFMSFIGGIDGELKASNAVSDFIMKIANAFDEIDQTTINAVKTAFEQLGVLAKTLWDNFGMVGDRLTALFSIFDGTEEAGEKVSALTRFVQILGVGIGFVSDGVQAMGMVADTVFGSWLLIIGKIVGAFENLMGNVTNYGDRMVEQGSKAVERAKTNMVNFSSQGAKALQEMGKTEQQHLDEQAKKMRDTYQKMLADGTESAEKLKEARLSAIEAEIAANKNAVNEVHERELAEMNLQAVVSETGKISFKVLNEVVDNTAKIKAQIDGATKALQIDSEKAMEGVSTTFNEFKVQLDNLIMGYDELAQQGLNASEMLTQGLDTMLSKAKNTHDVQAIIKLWEDLGEQGKITGERLAEGIQSAKDKLDELTDGINSTTEAYKIMGLQSKEELKKKAEQYQIAYEMIKKSGTATADTLKQAYEKYAKAHILAYEGVEDKALEAEAKIHGMSVTIDKSGKTSIETQKQLSDTLGGVVEANERVAESGQSAGHAMVDGANEAKNAWDDVKKSVDEANNAKDKAKSHHTQFNTATGIENFLKQAGVNEKVAAREARRMMANVSDKELYEGSHIFRRSGEHASVGMSTALLKLAERLRGQEASQEKMRQMSEIAQKTVNVNIKQGDKIINTSIPSGQENTMMEFLRQLENDKAISGR